MNFLCYQGECIFPWESHYFPVNNDWGSYYFPVNSDWGSYYFPVNSDWGSYYFRGVTINGYTGLARSFGQLLAILSQESGSSRWPLILLPSRLKTSSSEEEDKKKPKIKEPSLGWCDEGVSYFLLYKEIFCSIFITEVIGNS